MRLQEEGEHDQGKVALIAGHQKQTYADLLEVAADVEEGEDDDSTSDLLDEEAVEVQEEVDNSCDPEEEESVAVEMESF